MNYKIYGLRLKNTEDIKYIGYTSKCIEERLYRHKTDTIKGKYKNANWLKKYKDEVEIFLIEENILSHEQVCAKEKYYIKLYRDLGFDLNNSTDGGDGVIGLIVSEETRKKLSKASKGRKMSEVVKKKISESLKGKIVSEETKEKLKLINFGKKFSEETKQKMSSSKKNYVYTESQKKKMSESATGRKHTKQTLEKLSQKIEVYNYFTGEYIGIFNSHTECAKILNIVRSHISSVLNRKRNHNGGFTFKVVAL
jgi:group I intron endonuclease